MKKPTLTLPNKTPAATPQSEKQLAFGDRLSVIIVEEFERAECNKAVAFAAIMARITADQEFYQQLALSQIHRLCRKRLKRLNQARTWAAQATKEAT
jgi:2-oxo-4-hydroxy-4-carboxy--5-ureidoimidazoline (OHCU) decarboxylase